MKIFSILLLIISSIISNRGLISSIPSSVQVESNNSNVDNIEIIGKSGILDESKPKSKPKFSKIETMFENVKILRGETLKLECSSEGNPTPNITWTKDGKGLDAMLFYYKLQTGSLVIQDVVLLYDGGNYTCGVCNILGCIDFTYKVNVYRTCSSKEFKCSNEYCIPRSERCDKFDNCGDNSDEENCKEENGGKDHFCNNGKEFTCPKTGKCIPVHLICNGEDNCGDNSDEKECKPDLCNEMKFTCTTNRQCIPVHSLCDDVDNCGDGSDEINCTKHREKEEDTRTLKSYAILIGVAGGTILLTVCFVLFII